MTETAYGLAPALRPKPDLLTQLCRRLDQYRRSAKRCGRIDIARDLGEAARLLRAYRLDEEALDGGRQ
jgi:hypothetical protein